MREVITHPNYCLQFMQPGRLVRIRYQEFDFGWGVVVNFNQRKPARGQAPSEVKPHSQYIVEVLLLLAAGAAYGTQASQDLPPGVRPPTEGEKGRMEIVPVLLSCIEQIGHLRIFLPKELKSSEQRQLVRKSVDEVKKRFPDGIPQLDPIENMGITDDSFKKLLRVSSSLSRKGHSLISCRKLRCLSHDFCRILCTIRQDCRICTTNTHAKWKCRTKSRASRNKSHQPWQFSNSTSSNAESEC